eukprot:scaffold526384_cov51-Attheya_sp.AAC.1
MGFSNKKDRSSVGNQDEDDDYNGEEEALIRILATEIALDGGISYVSSLLQHCDASSSSSSSCVSAARVRQRIRRHAQTIGLSSLMDNESPENKGTTIANSSGGLTWFLSQYPHIFSLITAATSHPTKKDYT